MKVTVIGDYFGQTGYANHTKQLALALNKLCEVSMLTNKPGDWVRYVTDEELVMLNRPDPSEVCISIGLPMTAPLYWNKYTNFIQFVVWEGDKIPMFWVEYLRDDRIKQIWVPSQHTKDAIINTVSDTELIKKIKIVPHGVDRGIFIPNPNEKEKLFTFVANKGWRGGWLDRGGLAFLIKAFNEEFDKEDNVQLLIKINSVYAQINVQQEMALLKLKEKCPIKIVLDNIPFNMLPQVYNKGDVFVSTSLAEAFNMPCLEAMACGLPVLTTHYGGQSDFVNNDNGWILNDGALFTVQHDTMYEGIKWKKPSIKEIREKMRYIYNNQEEVKRKGQQALKDSSNHTWNNSAQIAHTNLLELT